jgi:hypothetical protein
VQVFCLQLATSAIERVLAHMLRLQHSCTSRLHLEVADSARPGCIPSMTFIQSMKLKNTLRNLKGEEMITHLGLEYYDGGQLTRNPDLLAWRSCGLGR